jgi:hypothetical protein
LLGLGAAGSVAGSSACSADATSSTDPTPRASSPMIPKLSSTAPSAQLITVAAGRAGSGDAYANAGAR